MSNERSKTILELALPVADRFQGDFEEARNYIPSERLCRSDLKDWLEEGANMPKSKRTAARLAAAQLARELRATSTPSLTRREKHNAIRSHVRQFLKRKVRS